MVLACVQKHLATFSSKEPISPAYALMPCHLKQNHKLALYLCFNYPIIKMSTDKHWSMARRRSGHCILWQIPDAKKQDK